MTEPSPEVTRELVRLLEQDRTRVGDVYRLSKRGLNPDQIAQELGVATSGFVSNNRTVARALLEGHVPNGSAAASQVASHLRRFAADPTLSDEAHMYLAGRLETLGRASGVQPPRRRAPARPSAPYLPSGSRPLAAGMTLRVLTEEELRNRTKALVDSIRDEQDIVADDYLRVATASSPLDELATLISTHTAGRSFASLSRAGRLDLSLEAQAISWADDLPLRADVVEAARARLAYYGYEMEGRS